jgi:hypothetical protein
MFGFGRRALPLVLGATGKGAHFGKYEVDVAAPGAIGKHRGPDSSNFTGCIKAS